MMNPSDALSVFKALADETRLQIVEMLADGEFCACKLLERFHFTQPTLSYHMRILTGSGLVRAVRDGSWMRYSLVQERFALIRDYAGDLASQAGVPTRKGDACQDPCRNEDSDLQTDACLVPASPRRKT